MIGAIMTAAATAWLVAATRADHRSKLVAKPVASVGFLLAALSQPFDDGARAWLLLAGLALGAIGDVALMGRSNLAFLGGLVAFLVGHLAYLAAFALDAEPGGWLVIGIAVAAGLGIAVLRWLRPHLQAPFTIAVPLYVLVICLMLAAGMGAAPASPMAAAGAVLFAASDLFVARERFVTRHPINPTVGLPVYYLAQLLIAFSI